MARAPPRSVVAPRGGDAEAQQQALALRHDVALCGTGFGGESTAFVAGEGANALQRPCRTPRGRHGARRATVGSCPTACKAVPLARGTACGRIALGGGRRRNLHARGEAKRHPFPLADSDARAHGVRGMLGKNDARGEEASSSRAAASAASDQTWRDK